jgi:uncharacterized protein
MRRVARILAGTTLALVCAGAALGIYGVFIEPDRLAVRHVSLTSPAWPKRAPALRLALLADIHAGSPHIDEAKLDAIVRRVNGERPDIVVLLGDYVIHGVLGGRFIPPEVTVKHLAGLKAPRGVYAVLGNHDWWYDGERIRRGFETAGITVLENESRRLSGQGPDFWIAGLADDSSRHPDGEMALRGIPTGQPVIVLMHDPAAVDQVPASAVLSLAGHTHGGQIYLPWLFPPVTPGRSKPENAYGLSAVDGRRLYVTGGIGTSILPIRVNMPPEIVILTILSEASG